MLVKNMNKILLQGYLLNEIETAVNQKGTEVLTLYLVLDAVDPPDLNEFQKKMPLNIYIPSLIETIKSEEFVSHLNQFVTVYGQLYVKPSIRKFPMYSECNVLLRDEQHYIRRVNRDEPA